MRWMVDSLVVAFPIAPLGITRVLLFRLKFERVRVCVRLIIDLIYLLNCAQITRSQFLIDRLKRQLVCLLIAVLWISLYLLVCLMTLWDKSKVSREKCLPAFTKQIFKRKKTQGFTIFALFLTDYEILVAFISTFCIVYYCRLWFWFEEGVMKRLDYSDLSYVINW